MRARLALALTVVPLVSGCAGGTSFGVAKSLARLEPRDGDHTYKIVASSMEPTLHCARPAPNCRAAVADRVLVRPYDSSVPRRGDIVAVKVPPPALVRCGAGGIFIKRVARVSHGRYFLLGDNRAASCDSRVWGWVTKARLVGKAVGIYWPKSRFRRFQ